ncbi:MAG: hypothetical protein HC886_11025 [Leptolyngbyaceae cyanobacterium SM1_1_3]|nr:hypothetical protein [Leptolyngbyaceae cyanobacterium SM1_1_3]NJO09227.1 hypothetical protein [Leptolyngbyaceae cyanobacterium SL_1_1]
MKRLLLVLPLFLGLMVTTVACGGDTTAPGDATTDEAPADGEAMEEDGAMEEASTPQ